RIDENEFKQFLIKCNKVEFSRAIINIQSNSWESLKNSDVARIEVLAKSSGCNIEVSIIDNGKGIPENIISKVAQENFTFGKENGTGHGLFQVSNLIKKQGGVFKINSTFGVGTKVDISFPV